MTAPSVELEIAGQVKITGGTPSPGRVLTDAGGGLAIWSDVVLSGGTTNYIARWLTATGLTTGLIYDNGTNVGIGTNSPTTRLTIDSGIANSG